MSRKRVATRIPGNAVNTYRVRFRARLLNRYRQREAGLQIMNGISLSSRETQVWTALAAGMQNKEIGAALGISVHTVDTHLRRIYAKLEVNSRTQALMKFITLGHKCA